MNKNFEYYYNHVPGKDPSRNNLIYTSLINKDRTVFVQWFHNDSAYHKGYNEVLDQHLMLAKWQRECDMLSKMQHTFADHVPKIIDIDHAEKKIYLEIQDVDFWEQSHGKEFTQVLPDWQSQMLEIIQAHQQLGLYKYSLHPSSYFIVNGKLKSINYFFCYHEDEPAITVQDHLSHISHNRRQHVYDHMARMGINVNQPTDYKKLQILCLKSFSDCYPKQFIDQAIKLFQ